MIETVTDALPMEGELKIAMIGMTEGNGHPYSWSAILNGYDRTAMMDCPYPVIPAYLNPVPDHLSRLSGARVTHIWTDDSAVSAHVAKCARIPQVAARAANVIGEVDAVIIATDRGEEHVDRCRPFVEAGVPVFVDKPMVIDRRDLRVFTDWVCSGAAILSTSCMRYAREFLPFHASRGACGDLRHLSITSHKCWERYGIHGLEAVYPILGPGFLSARNTGTAGRDIVHLRHRSGADVTVAVIDDMAGAFGCLQIGGTAGRAQIAFQDTLFAFRAQLAAFLEYVRTGIRPFPFSETEELMKLLIAGIESRESGGATVRIDD